jgi:hypothetical protein
VLYVDAKTSDCPSAPSRSSANLLQYFYSSFTVNAANAGELRRTQKGLDKRVSNLG